MNPPPATPPPLPRPIPPNWWQRNWKWFVPTAVVTLAVMMVAFVALIFFGIFGILKSTEPWKEAMARARANPELQSELGTPIEEGWFMTGNVNTSGSSGYASMDIPVSGPKGKARIYVEANKSAGTWSYTTLEAAIDGHPEGPRRIDLRH